MEERKTEQSLRGGWRPGFYMRPKHVGLVFCVSLIGCMVTFGVGFIVGMGYKASEQISPYTATKTPRSESVIQGRVASAGWNNEDITFYDALTNINKVPMEENEKPEPESLISGPARTPVPASPGGPSAVSEMVPRSAEDGIAANNGSREPAPVLPERTAAVRDANLESPTAGGTGSPSLRSEETSIATYSVQVASFRSAERAERMIQDLAGKGYHAYIHPFEVPGQPLWYRVKVGRFADRATASLTMEKLGDSDAMITRD
ncbi:MAG: SPOR domain-containing protein [Candidatus Tectomicrobia bacterium]|nr:SPOR domain-containing protein [Candidatus Tectomicrobia bacterium]